MDQIFNDPVVKNFLQTIKQNDKKSTLKELVLLGIHAVSSKIHQSGCRCCSNHCGCCGCVKVNRNWQAIPQESNGACCGRQGNGVNNNVAQQLEQIRNRIDQLSSSYHQPASLQVTKNDRALKQKGFNRSPTREAQNIQQNQNFSITNNGGQMKQFRHHLDDSQVRKALVNPYAKPSPIKNEKKKKSIEKVHLLQKERDEQQLKMNKERVDLFQPTYDISEQHIHGAQQAGNRRTINIEKSSGKKLKKTGLNATNEEQNNDQSLEIKAKNKNKSHTGARSKIKSLIEKDKQRSKRNAFSKKQQYSKSKYCQFEYSDESDQYQQEENAVSESQCPVHSHAKQIQEESEEYSSMQAENNISSSHEKHRVSHQASRKNNCSQQWQSFKENRKRMKKYKQSNSKESKIQEQQESKSSIHDRQEDEVSQSSSFSKFSMSSGRQNGKIMGLRK